MVKKLFLFFCCVSVLGMSACTLGEDTLSRVPGPSGDIVQAVCSGNLEAVKEAVAGGGDVNAVIKTTMYSVIPHKISLLGFAQEEAGSYGYSQIADYLLEQGADVNFLGVSGESPLMVAASNNDLALCEEYLQKGADIDLRSAKGQTALDTAACWDAPDAIMFLISRGAALTPDSLHLAMEHQSYRAANVLAKELKNREIDTGLSPILLAAVAGDSQAVVQLCNAGDLTPEMQVEAGYYTAAFCNAEALDAYVEHGFALYQEESAYTPVEIAAECGNYATVQYITEQHPEALTKNSARGALHFAAKRDDVEMVTYLLRKNVDSSGVLTTAAESGSLQTVKYLLKQPVTRDALEDSLYYAADKDQVECVKALLPAGEWGVDALNGAWDTTRSVEARKLLVSYGAKPTDLAFSLFLAVQGGNLEMVTYLLSIEADPDVVQEDGSYPLEFAISFGYYGIAELLIKHGADVNYTDPANADCTVLHTAAMSSTNLTRLLAEHGADVNAQTTQGYTPLMYAVESGKPATAVVLLQAGADARIQNEDGKTAEDLAEELGDEALKACFS